MEQGELRVAVLEGFKRHSKKRWNMMRRHKRDMLLKCSRTKNDWLEFWVSIVERDGKEHTYVRIFSKIGVDRPVKLLSTKKFKGRCKRRLKHMLDDVGGEAREMGFNIRKGL